MTQDWKIGFGKPTGIFCWLQGDENMKFLPFKKELKMNDKIKDLAEQATTYIDPSANDGVCWDFDKEKFAELIVRECALTAGLMEHEGRPNIGAGILDRFGVKE